MKTRNGFISNSSSSSFILGFDKIPENAHELYKLLFGDKEMDFADIYGDDNPESWTGEDVCGRLFDDIEQAKKYDKDSIIKEISSSLSIYDLPNEITNIKEELFDGLFTTSDIKKDEFFKKNSKKYSKLCDDLQNVEQEAIKKFGVQSVYACEKNGEEQNRYWDKYWEIQREIWDEECNIVVKFGKEYLKEKLPKNKVFVTVEYSDNDGNFACNMEHGIVGKLNCTQFVKSNH